MRHKVQHRCLADPLWQFSSAPQADRLDGGYGRRLTLNAPFRAPRSNTRGMRMQTHDGVWPELSSHQPSKRLTLSVQTSFATL